MRLGYALLFAVLIGSIANTATGTNVTFQCQMSVQIELGNFNPNSDTLVVRGSFDGWAGNDYPLLPNGTLYAITTDIPPGDIEYKFVMVRGGSDQWEFVENRTVTVETTPLVLPVFYFNNIVSSQSADVEVLFRVDMGVQTVNGNFDPETDWVVVRGGHDSLFFWGGSRQLYEEPGNPGVYSRWVLFPNLLVENLVEYKFVILDNGDVNSADWEIAPNRSFQATGQEPDNLPPPSGDGYGEITPGLVYFSDLSWDDVLVSNVDVVFSVDARPLYGRIADEVFIYDFQTGDTIRSVESIQVAGDFNYWPWGNFPASYFLNDSGVNGDNVAGDSVFSLTVPFVIGDPRDVTYKYGVNERNVEATFWYNHLQTIDDSQPLFRFATDCWGSQDNWYQDWPCQPLNRGTVSLVSSGPPVWEYELQHLSGAIDRFVFTGTCIGTSAWVSGAAESAGWSATAYDDSIVLSSATPLMNGLLGSFMLSHPVCDGTISWHMEDTTGTIAGPSGQGLPRAPDSLSIYCDIDEPSLILRWSRVTQDYMGQPLVPDAYYVFRSSEPDFPGGGI